MNRTGSSRSMLYLAVYDPRVPLSGAGARGKALVENLARHFSLDMVFMKGSGHAPEPDIMSQYTPEIEGVRTKISIPFSKAGYFLFSGAMYRTAATLVRENSYDFIFCDYGLSAVYGLLLRMRFDIPFIYSSHNIEYKAYIDKSSSDMRRLPLVPYVYLVERLAAQASHKLVAITEDDADFYTQWRSRDDIVVVPQGFDASIFNPFYEPPQNDPKIVLFVANYNNQTNRKAVMTVRDRILDSVLVRHPEVKFQFVGANPPRCIDHPKVEFTGFVDDYPAYLKRADVVISPIDQGQGAPTKIIEALACGKPIVSTPVGARTIERDYESLAVCEIEEFPELIGDALDNCMPVRTDDYELVRRRYGWNSNVDKLISLLEAKNSVK